MIHKVTTNITILSFFITIADAYDVNYEITEIFKAVITE